jgi:hypothetical protein
MKGFLILGVLLALSFASAYAQGQSDMNASGTMMNNTSNDTNMSNATGMGAGMTGNSSGCSGMNASMGNESNATANTTANTSSTGASGGSAYSMGVSKNETSREGVSNQSNETGMGGGMQMGGMLQDTYTYDQKEQMIKDMKDQLKELDLKIDTAKRHGDNASARTTEQDRDRLKKQLGEVKKANRDNWDQVSGNALNMMKEMNLTQ